MALHYDLHYSWLTLLPYNGSYRVDRGHTT